MSFCIGFCFEMCVFGFGDFCVVFIVELQDWYIVLQFFVGVVDVFWNYECDYLCVSDWCFCFVGEDFLEFYFWLELDVVSPCYVRIE